MRQYLDGRAMDDVAIERIRSFEPQALELNPLGYAMAHSGGKDSTVAYDLMVRAGVKVGRVVHRLTTADPPELVRFVKWLAYIEIVKPERTMWQWIRHKRGMPTQGIAWCCDKLKHSYGRGWLTITGIRAEEGLCRAGRGTASYNKDSKSWTLNPIIDWTTADVWDYIRERGLRYCELYDQGFGRLGCVGCPKTSAEQRAIEFARWPRIASAWKRACVWAWEHEPKQRARFETAESMWRWWTAKRATGYDNADTAAVLFEDNQEQAGDQ